MSFNSLDFAVFLPVVFFVYWLIGKDNRRLQNSWLVVASYYFYGSWDWHFLSLIVISTAVDYFVGLGLESNRENKINKKCFLWLSLTVNLGLLAYFKYQGFFVENFVNEFSLFGKAFSKDSLNVILPVGISFYTFQTMSYSIDISRGQLKPTRDFIAFSAFVSFFPQLVAGPIERASHLLPQFETKREFDRSKSVDGLRQLLWGLLKKIVIADNCGEYANEIFNNSNQYEGSTLVIGVVFFSFQIFADFSGYSDIAIGTSRLFGFDLMQNFATPYFSRSISEYWRRWHISFSTWLRDYVYIPLGGGKGGKMLQLRNLLAVFLISGLWHGRNWTFMYWAILNVLFFLPSIFFLQKKKYTRTVAEGRLFPSFQEIYQMLLTFILVLSTRVFFRAEDIDHAVQMIKGMMSFKLFEKPVVFPETTLYLILAFMIVEWLGREDKYAIEKFILPWPKLLRWGFYYVIVFVIFYHMGEKQTFIYFQF